MNTTFSIRQHTVTADEARHIGPVENFHPWVEWQIIASRNGEGRVHMIFETAHEADAALSKIHSEQAREEI